MGILGWNFALKREFLLNGMIPKFVAFTGKLQAFCCLGKIPGWNFNFKMRHLIEKNCTIKWKSVHFGVLKMTINDHFCLFSDFDSFEKLNLLSKLATMKLLISLVWIWNLLLSLLWLKSKYCINTQKSCVFWLFWAQFSMYIDIKLLFLRSHRRNR